MEHMFQVIGKPKVASPVAGRAEMSAAVLSPPAQRPGHVPEAAVYDYDMFHDPELLTDPHARILQLARSAPKVFWTPRNGGHWIFQGQNAVWEAARDPDSFSNESIPYEELKAILAS